MTVYVDEIKDYTRIAKMKRLRHTHWCHLTADTEEELHAFAEKIGLKRSWYQKKGPDDHRWHYDITPGKKELALRHNAVDINWRQMVQILNSRKPSQD